MSQQLFFVDDECFSIHSLVRMEVLLGRIKNSFLWGKLLSINERVYPKARSGGESYFQTMSGVHYTQPWHSLGDDSAERSLCESSSLRYFERLSLIGKLQAASPSFRQSAPPKIKHALGQEGKSAISWYECSRRCRCSNQPDSKPGDYGD